MVRKNPPSSSLPASMDTSEDPDAEEALKSFDFLPLDDMDTSSESRGTGDGTDWGESHVGHKRSVHIFTYCNISSCVTQS